MNRQNLPGTWSSTSNALEVLTFGAKDALFVIDDFAPHGSHTDIARYHAAADRVFRAAGNHAGRSRLDASVQLRESKAPRALILSTGEDVPRGHSIRARLLTLELERNKIDSNVLSARQKDAADGLYALSMGAFVQYVAANYLVLQERLQEFFGQRQKEAYSDAIHARTPAVVASLQAAFELFLEFAEKRAVIDICQAPALRDRCWRALLDVAAAQRLHQESANPAERFIEILRSLLTSGGVHFQSRYGGIPEDSPESWGWRKDGNLRWTSRGSCVGWVIDDGVFLDLTAALSAVQTAGRNLGENLGVSEQTLKKRLHENGFLERVDKGRATSNHPKNNLQHLAQRVGASSQRSCARRMRCR